MVKKEEARTKDNSFGVAGVVLGIIAVVISLNQPFGGLALGIVAVVFSVKQSRFGKTKWTKAGKVLGWIAIILSVIVLVLGIVYVSTLLQDPNFAAQLQGGY